MTDGDRYRQKETETDIDYAGTCMGLGWAHSLCDIPHKETKSSFIIRCLSTFFKDLRSVNSKFVRQ